MFWFRQHDGDQLCLAAYWSTLWLSGCQATVRKRLRSAGGIAPMRPAVRKLSSADVLRKFRRFKNLTEILCLSCGPVIV